MGGCSIFSDFFPILILVFSILKLHCLVYYKAFQSAHAFRFFFGMIFLFYEYCLSQVSSKRHFKQTCHFLLFKRKFSNNHATKPSYVSIYCIKRVLKSHSFQEKRASKAVSSKTNRADKIILNISGVAL